MQATATQCKHGWSIEYLRKEEAFLIQQTAEIEASSHPFKAEMAEGNRKALATVRKHLAGE